MTEFWMEKLLNFDWVLWEKQFISIYMLCMCVYDIDVIGNIFFFVLLSTDKLMYLWPKNLGFMKNYQFIVEVFFFLPSFLALSVLTHIYPKLSDTSPSPSYFFPILNKLVSSFMWFIARFFISLVMASSFIFNLPFNTWIQYIVHVYHLIIWCNTCGERGSRNWKMAWIKSFDFMYPCKMISCSLRTVQVLFLNYVNKFFCFLALLYFFLSSSVFLFWAFLWEYILFIAEYNTRDKVYCESMERT